MTSNEILMLFEQMLSEHWSYILGSAQKGCVDCSGAFVYAYKTLDGMSIYHGSNWMARNEVTELLPISQAEPGMIAFKVRKPGAKNYNLPERYKDSGDTNDYYHVGLVSRDGKSVLNAAGAKTGFSSSALSKWSYVGYGKHITYEGETAMETMTVTAESGSTVNRRTRPETSAPILDRIKVGTQVQVLATDGTWSTVQFDGATGYMMSKFLTSDSAASTVTLDELQASVETLKEQYEELKERIQALEGAEA